EVNNDIQYKDLYESIYKDINNDDINGKVKCLDIYKENEKSETKRITFGLAIRNFNKTLNEKDIKAITSKVTKKLENSYQAIII
ncbi:hypothetical protein KKA50_00470, partial [Patescibacteria group bacterium]|nr:hypothetical protein [Patescibacteria group bacterium]